ncbi:response regulator [Neobacillus sp. 3P2-tot-E-2]|uniref:response regulator transcription factor n=1 Tax=Neobacillus sp. 3P2-tot-E-2 TaxID=3132212 RepID=UPI00399FF9E0
MIKLLIVDDEPYIVEGLFEMLSELTSLDIELYMAYSADEAIQRLLSTKMDIVISDIRMPGMNGLELQRWISDRWPKCKVIFLTGFGDIHYAQEAIRFGCSDYILKTEGDESILRSINNAIAQINADVKNDQILINAQQQFLQALPVLHKQWFMEVIDPKRVHMNLNEQKFHELKIQLSLNEKVLLLGGRVDCWDEHKDFSTQLQLMHMVQNIVEENLNRVQIQSIVMEESEIIWLIQPKLNKSASFNLPLASINPWEDTLSYVTGSMESIQGRCRRLLELPISLVCTGEPINWDDMEMVYSQIKQTMDLGLGNGQEMLIIKCDEEQITKESEVYRNYLTQDEKTHHVIKKLNKYIPENLSTDLSLNTLANLVYMNPSYLSTLYKQYTGKNISDYITELRVEKAKGLLQNSSFKIHEIAEEVGFSTSGYFTRFFKKHVGVTPQEYRN